MDQRCWGGFEEYGDKKMEKPTQCKGDSMRKIVEEAKPTLGCNTSRRRNHSSVSHNKTLLQHRLLYLCTFPLSF